MSKVALILGASSQDSHYLIEHLLEKGYKVVGAVRRASTDNLVRIRKFLPQITLDYFDATDASSISRLILEHKPSHIFNLVAQSYVGVSFHLPVYTGLVDGIGVAILLETVRQLDPSIRVLQASTSELYGGIIENMGEKGFHEDSPMVPRSPYAIAKQYGYEMCKLYRQSYNMFVSNSICFNHTSAYRGDEFLEKKAINAFLNKDSVLRLGYKYSKRDYGHSSDYVKAMTLILEADKPDDYVIATGSMLSPGDVVRICQENFDYSPEIVWDCPEFVRPSEVEILLGDSSKIRRELGWQPSFNSAEDIIISIIKEMKQL